VQERRFVRLADFAIFKKLVDLMFAELVVNLVRIIAGKNPGLVADALDGVSNIGFFTFAADKDSSGVDMASNILADLFFGPKLEEAPARVMLNVGFPGPVEAFQADQHPRDAAFHEAELHVRELVEDAVKDHAAERNHLAERMAERMNRRVGT
jgi:hypothetical protein